MRKATKRRQKAVLLKYQFIYRRIKSDKILFSRDGFKHFVYAKYGKRNFEDILRRISFVPQIPKILEDCPEPIEIRGEKRRQGNKTTSVCYRVYETITPDGHFRLITREGPASPKPHFLSLFKIE